MSREDPPGNREDRPGDGMGSTPSFSIVIPTLNRPRQLEQCLAALAELDYPSHRIQLIIVDDGSRPPMSARPPAGWLADRTTWLRQDNAGPAAARNFGASHATGEYLAFTDDDCLPTSGWLRQLAAALALAPDALVGGHTTNALPTNLYAVASQVIIDVSYARLLATHSELRFFASNNFAVKAAHFRCLGGFDPAFRTSEDRDFCDRWLRAGRALALAPDAVVRHSHELTLGGFWRQHFAYGRGACRFHLARARRGAGRLRPDTSYYRAVFLAGLASPTLPQRLALSGLFLAWQAANAAGYLWQRSHRQ